MGAQPQRPGTPLPVPHAPRPKILRIGVILGEKIVEERLIRNRENVTIRQSAKNTSPSRHPSCPGPGSCSSWWAAATS
jgi:hypothetical protein